MSATAAAVSCVSFAPGPRAEASADGSPSETRPAPTSRRSPTDAATLHEVALFLRDDPSTTYDLFLDLASVDRLDLPGAAGAEGREPLPGELHPLLDEAERAPAGSG